MNQFTNEIRKLEKLKYCDEKDRAKMILVYLGLKPACEVYVYEKEVMVKLKQSLLEVGLHCVKLSFNKKPFDEWQKVILQRLILPVGQCAVAKTKKTAIRLSKTLPHKHHRRFGKLMGYPQTAIDNFIKKEPSLDFKRFMKLNKKHGIIFSFRIPAKNYQNELKILKNWSLAIKRYAPTLYKRLLKFNTGFGKKSVGAARAIENSK